MTVYTTTVAARFLVRYSVDLFPVYKPAKSGSLYTPNKCHLHGGIYFTANPYLVQYRPPACIVFGVRQPIAHSMYCASFIVYKVLLLIHPDAVVFPCEVMHQRSKGWLYIVQPLFIAFFYKCLAHSYVFLQGGQKACLAAYSTCLQKPLPLNAYVAISIGAKRRTWYL